MEAIFWRKVDRRELRPAGKAAAVFRQRGYWAAKNPKDATSREQFTQGRLTAEISRLEAALGALGFGQPYWKSIRSKVTGGLAGVRALQLYKVALERTVRSKQRAAVVAGQTAG